VIQGLNADGHLLAYHDRSDGGLLTSVAKWPSPATAA
jgi:phosphoribosylformylglycinamidine synthase